MNPLPTRSSHAVGTAMLGAAAVGAQFIAGKAARDAIYLANLDVTSLPVMVMVAAAFSIALVALQARALRTFTPATLVPWMFLVSAALLCAELLATLASPRIAAPLVYLHISGLGPMLGSGFWLIATERFDPHTAKQRFGQIAGMGTLGGLLGGLLAERVGAVFGATTLLPVLAAINLLCAWQVRRLAHSSPHVPPSSHGSASQSPAASGFRALAAAPYLRTLAAVVFLGTLGPAMLDYLFKAHTVSAFGRGDALLRFFAIYYAATSLLIFVLQTAGSRVALAKLGLGASASTPSLALAGGAVGGLLAPGLESILAARAGETVLRGSIYRAAYELFYTPLAPGDKRAAKAVIDVGFDRFGEAVGGGVVRLMLVLPPVSQQPAGLGLTLVCALLTLAFATRLNRGYVTTLERKLLDHSFEMDPSDAHDVTTRTVVLKTLRLSGSNPTHAPESDADQVLADIAALRSKDRGRILQVLDTDGLLEPPLVTHVVPLLARDSVAGPAVRALRRVADAHVGLLSDALLDPAQPFAVRRRVARVFSVCTSQRAVDTLLAGLGDLRFEVRYHCGRSLAILREQEPNLRIDRDSVLAAVLREVKVSREAWEGHRILERSDEGKHPPFVHELLMDRASQSLAHVFTLLSLVLTAEPLRIAFHGLHTDDEHLRGTALEYLEAVVPVEIRDRLWPLLDARPGLVKATRDRDAIVRDLLQSHASIELNLQGRRGRAQH